MPRILFNPHPFEFIDRGATITLRTELYDTERTIHMDRAEPPAAEPASRLGYSVGPMGGRSPRRHDVARELALFRQPAARRRAVPWRIVERYTLSEDQSRLDFRVNVTDPSTFTVPAVIDGHWLALGGSIPRYDCQPR